ncbi:unnamed protein product [Rotaria sp. Silwood1]|nr:unnamed protein product [Rotaria sp. Silwood1]CAF3711142.1 unnamed protein product [Rotaria sp. Silwood1]CAF4715653.1 unnamed protein product [Rotaria sp. Silwood1]
MNEKNSRRSRCQPPSSYGIVYRSQRSRSLSNDGERTLSLESVFTREHKLSMANKIEFTPTEEKGTKVAELVEQFEKVNSKDNVQLRNKNKCPLSSFNRFHNVRTSTREMWTSLPEKKNITTISTSHFIPTYTQSLLSNVSTFEINKDITSDSNSKNKNSDDLKTSITYDSNQSNDLIDSHHIKLDTISSNSMSTTTTTTTLKQTQVQHPEIFIKSQPNPIHNFPNIDFNISSKFDSFDGSSIDETKEFDIKQKESLLKCLDEVYVNEEKYIKKLYVLSFKVSDYVKKTCQRDENLLHTFNSVYKPLLDTIKRLYKFHYECILPDMIQYKIGHRTDNIWSIFIEHFQTIENLYKEYYIVYDENQQKLERLCTTNPLIHEAMLQCQVHLGNLYPINELNCANQHLLRYMLLMKTYMQHLDEDSADYDHTCFVHDELSYIADRCQEYLAVSPAQLNKLKLRVDSKPECFDKQQLIWHGRLKRQLPRKPTDIVQYYVILFSNCILICGESGNKLEIKRQLSIKNIKVEIIERERLASASSNSTNVQQLSFLIYYPFHVNAIEKSYEFLPDKESDREKWVNKIRQASEDFQRRNATIEIRQSFHRTDEQQLGTRAPSAWVNYFDVTRCQICYDRFSSKLISSRHHCRSCGRCICSSCSTKKLILKYCNTKGEVRVCDQCYKHFTGIDRNRLSSQKITRDENKTILFGDFRFFPLKSIIWIELQEDYQLHIYGGKLDQVEDFSIDLSELNNIIFVQETQTFILNGKDKTYRLSMEINHQTIYPKNDYIDTNIQNTKNKVLFYANLWHDTMQLARLKITPVWYTRKRDSADSGISNI